MLRITYNANEEKKNDIALEVEGDYIDVGPLFKLSFPRKRAETYMTTNAHRREYKEALDKELGKESIYTVTQPTKRRFYHKLLVKILLYALDLLDFEVPIASVWEKQCCVLQTLPGYNFSHVKISLTFYDDYGREAKHDVRIAQRTRDGWMNITFGLRNYDGSAKKTTATVTKNKLTLFRRLYKIDNDVDDVDKLMKGLATKTEKKELECNRRNLHKRFVDSESNVIETWVEPNVFFSALLDCSIDFHKIMTQTMLGMLFGEQGEGIRVDQHADYEFISNERRIEMQKNIETQLAEVRATQAEHKEEANKIKREARLLGLTSDQLKASSK